LLTFIEKEPSGDSDETARLIQSIIESSDILRKKVNEWMLKLNINANQFNSIRNIFNLPTKSSILFHVKQKEFLLKLLANNKQQRTNEFYLQWFMAFMKPDSKQKFLVNIDGYKELFKTWTACFAEKYDTLIYIIKTLDSLIPVENKPNYSTYFIEHMVDICFQQSKQCSEYLLFKISIILCYFRKNYRKARRQRSTCSGS